MSGWGTMEAAELMGFTPYKERFAYFGMWVDAYRNLNEQRRTGRTIWSIRDQTSRLVVGHATSLTLHLAKVHTNDAEAARIAAGGARSVHAWVSGRLINFVPPTDDWWRVTYRPHQSAKFIDVDSGAPLSTVSTHYMVSFTEAGMFVRGEQ